MNNSVNNYSDHDGDNDNKDGGSLHFCDLTCEFYTPEGGADSQQC